MREWGENESKEFPALDLTRELGFLRGEVHIQVCVCVCASAELFIYRACSVHREGELLYPVFVPFSPSLAPVSGNTPEQPPLYVSILSNGKPIHINLILFPQLRVMTAIRETDDQHNTQLIN